MGAHRSGSAWTKRKARTLTAKALAENLASRKLDTLDTCRTVWAESFDPLALVEAIRLSNLPVWLSDALLLAIFETLVDGRGGFSKLWKRSLRSRREGDRAYAVALARSNSPLPTWSVAYEAARRVTAKHVTPKAMEKAYRKTKQEVEAGLLYCFQANDGLEEHVDAAAKRVAALMQQRIDRPLLLKKSSYRKTYEK